MNEAALGEVVLRRRMFWCNSLTKSNAFNWDLDSLKNTQGRRRQNPYTILANESRKSALKDEQRPNKIIGSVLEYDALSLARNAGL